MNEFYFLVSWIADDGRRDGRHQRCRRAQCGGVTTLTLTISNPPTQAQLQAVVAKLNELITALHH
jgi:hypothetical protein